MPGDVIECPQCGFPQNGDEASQRWFLGQLRHDKLEENKAAFGVAHTFHLLLGIPVTLFLSAYSFWKNAGNIFAAETLALTGLVFLSIWIFGHRNPYRAFAISLGLYVLLTVPLFIYKPYFLVSHMMLIGPFVYLPIGLYSFKDWQKLDKYLDGKNSG